MVNDMKIGKDLQRYSEGSIKKAILTILINPCFHTVCLYRLSSLLYRIHLTPLAKIVWYINRLLFHVDIDFRSQIMGGLKIVHGLGIVVGHEVRAKENLTIYQHVTLGGSMGEYLEIDGVRTGQPYIEDNVTIYTGAAVFGPVHIESNDVIKAGKYISTHNYQKRDRD